ncbi:MAG TPA: DUF4234 domain-containing protein [Acidimicrobiia bacterium]|jgi:hypothetical protein
MTATVQSQAQASVPGRTAGKQRSALGVIGLTIITLGIYSLVWLYKTFQEMKDWSGEGVGGLVGLLLGFIPFVTLFLMPSEVKNLYERDGASSPVSPATGLWVLLPFIGGLVWLFKVQGALSNFWASHS